MVPMFEYPAFFFIIIITIIPLTVYLFYSISRKGKTRSEPTNWPVVGMLPAVIQNLRRVHDYATEVLTECGGTYAFKGPWFWNIDMLVTSDPANIHHIFTKNFTNYPKGPEFRKIFDVLGDGIFNADFELWEVHRRTTLSLLTQPDFFTSLARNVWGKVETGLIPVLDSFIITSTGKGIDDFDLQDIFQRFTFDVICKFVLDVDPCSLCVELPYVPCEKAFNLAVEPLLHRHILPESIWKLQKWLKIGNEKKLMEASEAFAEFIYPKAVGNDDCKVMAAFRKAYEEKNIGPENGLRTFLKDTALSLMLAGRDTTSACLTWLFWLLATNPLAEKKVLEEMEREILSESGKWRVFSAQEAGKLIYLHGALCESLRLFPPVALEHKAPVRPDVLPTGHQLRPNEKLIVCFYSMGRMEAIWGKDCLEFKPERWISPGGRGMRHEPSYKFPAFNVGPRACLGKEMAFVQMKMVATAVIYHYQVRLVDGHVVAPRDSIILQARNGLKVRLSKRNPITQS